MNIMLFLDIGENAIVSLLTSIVAQYMDTNYELLLSNTAYGKLEGQATQTYQEILTFQREHSQISSLGATYMMLSALCIYSHVHTEGLHAYKRVPKCSVCVSVCIHCTCVPLCFMPTPFVVLIQCQYHPNFRLHNLQDVFFHYSRIV